MLKVLVTGATRNTGMAALYALRKKGYTVIGTDERALPFNIHSRHTKQHYLHLPFSNDLFFNDVLSIIKKEKPDVLLPVGGSKNISMHKKEIKKFTNLLIPEYENFISAYDKKIMHRKCIEAGISVPQRYTDEEAISILNSEKKLKLVIKPDYDAGGAYGLEYVTTNDELETARINIQKRFGGYIIEEFIPGASRMRAVQLLFNKENEIVAHFILKKIYQWPITGGVTAYAESTKEQELIEFVLPFFEKCPWEGPVEIEIIIDERDGKPKIIEINPRFPGSISFPIQCGVNFPYILCMEAINRSPESPPYYNSGMFYINYSYYLKAISKEFRIAENKISFLYKTLKELKKKKVSNYPDKKDFIFYLVKAFVQILKKI